MMNRKQKQWSPNSLCIKNFIILFSVVAISLAWTYLIYESMHHTNAAFGGGAGDLPAQKVDMLTGAASDPKRASLTTPVATSPPVGAESASGEKSSTSPPVYSTVIAPTQISFESIHFIHIPKCGGTSMSAVLRQVMCQRNPETNAECCTNPGFCDWHAHRRCPVIKGCINHFPHRPFIFEPMPSIAIFRHPVSRLISAYFYRGHSPNNDFFQVRPEFKEIREGKRPKVSFGEYLEIHEYNNIMTRMLGADSFPYRNITVTDKVYDAAIEAVDRIFFVGIQEVYDFSVELLLREFDMKLSIDLPKERQDTTNKKLKKDKDDVKNNVNLMKKAEEVNYYDMKLYRYVLKRFCGFGQKYPDFNEKMKERRISCN